VAHSFSNLVISASIATGFNVSLVAFAFAVLLASRFVSGEAGWHADTPTMSANTKSARQSELLFIEHLLDERLGKLKDAGLLLREFQTTVNQFLSADYADYIAQRSCNRIIMNAELTFPLRVSKQRFFSV
jgi:hypothetical protein